MNRRNGRQVVARRVGSVIALAAGLCVAALALPAVAGKHDAAVTRRAPDFEWSGKLARGGTIEIRGVNGGIVALPSSGDQIEVTAVKTAHLSNPEDVRIEMSTRADRITICTVYSKGSGNEPTGCESGSSWHSRTHNSDVEVEYQIKVPAGLRFVGRTVNGSIEARDLSGPIEAVTVNGSVDVATSDAAEAETVNGAIHASIGRSRWTDPIEFKTVNGSIHVSLPPNVGAELHASTMNGDIDSDFPLTVRGRLGGKRLSGTLGKGGGSLRLENINGGISIVAMRPESR